MLERLNDRKTYADILDLLPVGLLIIDSEGTIIFANRTSQKFNGLSWDEMVGRTVQEMQEEDYFAPAASLLTLRSKKVENVIQVLKNNRKLLVFSYPLFDDDGELMYVVTLATDVNEQILLKQQLEEKEDIARSYAAPVLDESEDNPAFHSRKMEKIDRMIRKVADSDINILLTGESGVGKTFWARRIHEASGRADKNFLTINCSAIPEQLLESELFGYEKGAFTGASEKGKKGLFEVADHGTIFLDEIGELSPAMQVKLLQVLQDREIRHIGGSKTIPVDFRLITATNQDLQAMIESRGFREDLYYRLNGFNIRIPSLRERPEDIPLLAFSFLDRYNEKNHSEKKLSQRILSAFRKYPWPGNIRELEHVIESACILSEYEVITFDDLPENFHYLAPNYDSLPRKSSEIPPLQETLEIVEADLVCRAYEKTKNSYETAKLLRISQASAWRKIQKYCGTM